MNRSRSRNICIRTCTCRGAFKLRQTSRARAVRVSLFTNGNKQPYAEVVDLKTAAINERVTGTGIRTCTGAITVMNLNKDIDIMQKTVGETSTAIESLKVDVSSKIGASEKAVKTEIGASMTILQEKIGSSEKILQQTIGSSHKVLEEKISSLEKVLKAELSAVRDKAGSNSLERIF